MYKNDLKCDPDNPHPLSTRKTELVWEGKHDEYGNRREVDIAGYAMPMQKNETIYGQHFEHHWQTYCTRKDCSLPTVSNHEYDKYPKKGKYTACVKVVDIFSSDTSVTVGWRYEKGKTLQ